MFECVSVYPCACLCACLCVCVRLCGLSVCLYLCVYVLVWVSLRLFVCLCLCECTYIQPILPPKLSQSPSVEDSLGRWRDTTCPMIPCGEDFQTWLSPTLSLRLFFRVSYLWRRGEPQIMVGNLMSSTLFWMCTVDRINSNFFGISKCGKQIFVILIEKQMLEKFVRLK